MKISELSRQSGVPLATIKFYLREGLLAPGEAVGSNQAQYGEAHLRRLALIRTLKDVGGLSLAAIKKVLALIDTPDVRVMNVLGAAVDALSDRPESPPPADPDHARAAAEIDRLMAVRGWRTRPDAAARQDLEEAVVAMRRVCDPEMSIEALERYARVAEELAAAEIDLAAARMASDPTEALQTVVMGTVLFEPVLVALRRLAHEHFAGRLLNPEGEPRA